MRGSGKLGVALCVVALGAGCGPNIPKAKFYHAQHGVVASDDARLAAVRNACGKTAYAQGITIDGKLVTDRDVAIKAWTKHLVEQVMVPGAGAIAGTQGALAVATGDPSIATSTPSSARSQFKKPPYDARLNELENQTWACVEQHGWKKQTPS
ncbi:MAG: hypothetical protein K0U34_00955 [Alphaproteobacteria bacterium]|nr:hypothetical protein [Alphaproteobacteria bacterium]